MNIVLDVAAGILLAHGVRASIADCARVVEEDSREGERNPVTYAVGIAMILAAAAFVGWRVWAAM